MESGFDVVATWATPASTSGRSGFQPYSSHELQNILRHGIRFVFKCNLGVRRESRGAACGLVHLSIEELMNVEVTSVSKRSEKLSVAPAAVSVVSADEFRRSGVTSIPRPCACSGMEVARVDAHNWAITARGFNDLFANKLLVLMDGRSVYTPLFSGVYWDAQDTLLEDIDRIEVIRVRARRSGAPTRSTA